ncbi:hypothetical protein [Agromyces archimandritae]|uniref:DUF7847 domain-containing protein n=1 Tax=Agromyces archimandritae TaxID=2781962 RepID=A0A975FNJ9_9MICO|nr:hypothetical protein [Agromyces archimandritae]QTX05231.1 hypothetical protein G127AT_03105 [Agromyces archimandritae]
MVPDVGGKELGVADANWSPIDPGGPANGRPGTPGPGMPPPAYGAQPGGPGASYPGPQPGWTPPPKPGLIPLRPLGFGTMLGAPFQVIRRNPGPTIGSGVLVIGVVNLLTLAVLVPIAVWTFARSSSAAPDERWPIVAGGLGIAALAMLVPIAANVLGTAFLQGVIARDVASGTLGERLGFGTLWRQAARHVWPLAAWTLLTGAVGVLVFGGFVGIVVIGAVLSPIAFLIALLACLLLSTGVIVLGLWLMTKLAVVPTVIVLEDVGVFAAVRRSWQLTNGAFWRTLGLIALMNAILNAAASIVTMPLSMFAPMLVGLFAPTGTDDVSTVAGVAITIATSVLSILLGSVASVIMAATYGLIYVDRRMRTEGLDLELQRTVEARAAGRPTTDPFTAGAPSR